MRTQAAQGQFVGGEIVELALSMFVLFYLGVIYVGHKADEACKKRKRRRAERAAATDDAKPDH